MRTVLLWPWHLLSQLGLARQQLLLLAVLSTVVALLMLVPTLYLLQVFDRVLVSQNRLTLVFVSLIALYLVVVMAYFDSLRSRLLQWVVARFDTLRAEHIFNQLSQRFLNPATSSRSQVSQAFADLQETRQFLVSPLTLAWFDAPLGIIFCAAVFLLHPILGFMALVFVGVQLLYAVWVHMTLGRAGQGQQQAHQQESHFLAPRMAALDTTQVMGMRPQLVAHWSALREQDNLASLRTQHLSQTLAGVSKSIRYLQQGLVLGAAAWLVIQGELSLGSMIAANVLVMRVLAPIDQLTSGYKTMASFHAAARRLLGIAAAPESKPLAAPSLVHTSSSSAPGWHWQALSVNPGSGVLCQPTTHHVAAGTLTLVQGPSGVGKSLLLKGALGLLPLGWLQGTVQWVDPASSQPSVLPSVGYLSQEVDLFTGTIAQNIARMGEPNAELVLQAAQAAGLHSLIVHLPMGYQTPVGHAGQQLPGGIRQRVGLARALYGSPQLLVLDEPDAHLDDLGLAALEQAIQQAQQQGSTIVLISHRPAWTRLASSVLTLTPSSS